MKKKYKNLKKWAKTAFVILLTICIVFTATGVSTLFVYADQEDVINDVPTDPVEGEETGEDQDETDDGDDSDGESGSDNGIDSDNTGNLDGEDDQNVAGTHEDGSEHDYAIQYLGDGKHALVCSVCGDVINTEECTMTADYESNNDGTHKIYLVCSVCGARELAAESEACTFDAGVCTACGYEDPEQDDTDISVDGDISINDTESIHILGEGVEDIAALGDSSEWGTWGYYERYLFYERPKVLADSFTYTGNSIEVMDGGRTAIVGSELGGSSKKLKKFDTVRFYLEEDTEGGKLLEIKDFPDFEGTGRDLGTVSLDKTHGVGTYNIGVYLKYIQNQTMSYKNVEVPLDVDSFKDFSHYYTVKITPAYIWNCEIKEEAKNGSDKSCIDYSYMNNHDGKEILKLGDYVLEKDKDYTISDVNGGEIAFPEAGQKYKVKVTGINNFTGNTILEVGASEVDVKYDDKKKSEYENAEWTTGFEESVTLSSATEGYTVSLHPERGFKSSVVYDIVGKNQTVNLFFKKDNVVIMKTITDLTVNGITIEYNGKETKESSYTDKVDITADGYLISTSKDGSYEATYTHNKIGNEQSFYLYFSNINKPDNTPIKKLISDITIVKGEAVNGTSEGLIGVGEYCSDEIAATDEIVATFKEPAEIDIWAVNDKYEVTKKEYATSEELFKTASDIEGAAIDGKINWKPYNDSSLPTIPENKAVYIYARITDSSGGYTYLSTGKVIHDGVAPLMKSVEIGTKDKNKVLSVKGEDKLSGVESFYVLYEKKTDDQKVPSASDVKSKGTQISEITTDSSGVASGSLSIPAKDLGNENNYIYYVVSVDKVGNISEVEVYDPADSSGKITVDTYTSKNLARTDETVYVTKELKTIEITAENKTNGISKIEYATTEEVYYSVSDIEGAVTDGKIKWKKYDSASSPSLPENKAVYIYARITDSNGKYIYLSTGKIIHDTIKPTVTTVSLEAREGDQILPIVGQDTLSGIESFYVTYVEKKDGQKAPNAQEVVDSGRSAQPEVSESGAAAASLTYSTSDLKSDITYVFYVVAKDKAGNISDVKTYETKGKGPKSEATEEEKKEENSGLPAAPNGIAGSGGGDTKAPEAKGDAQKAGAVSEAEPEAAAEPTGLDRDINRVPYISEATGDTPIGLAATGGWDRINKEVRSADPGTRISVELSGFTIVPASFTESMSSNKVTATIKMPEDIEWVIESDDIDEVKGEIDLGVKTGSNEIPASLLDEVTGAYPHTELSINHDGAFGFEATLRVPLSASNAGMYGNLFYFDKENGELRLISSSKIGPDGYGDFKLSHASEYTVVVRAEQLAAGPAAKDGGTLTQDSASESVNRSSSLGLQGIPGINSAVRVRIWLFTIAFVSAVLCAIIIFAPSFQTNREQDREEIL